MKGTQVKIHLSRKRRRFAWGYYPQNLIDIFLYFFHEWRSLYTRGMYW